MADALAAKRAARKAKILAAGETRLGKITQLYSQSTPESDDPPLYIAGTSEPASDKTDSWESVERPAETDSIANPVSPISGPVSLTDPVQALESVMRNRFVPDQQPTFKSLVEDEDSAASLFTDPSFTPAPSPATPEETDAMGYIHSAIFTLIASFFVYYWILSTGSLNHPAKVDPSNLTNAQWMKGVCSNLVWMSVS
jgi:hypothetical protein